MERVVTIEEAKQLFGENFIGSDELSLFISKLGLDITAVSIPKLDKYSYSVLEKFSKEGYIMILGIEQINGIRITLEFLRLIFGTDPNESEPCFYNQDWYIEENFFREFTLDTQWYLIKKEIIENTRAEQPIELIKSGMFFPSAILCAYTFFAYFFAKREFLWYYDFVWNSDVDHNGDRIYVGKYHDISGKNKNGFSIHRHLSLRNCYGAVSII